jgi:hypothetical protein
MNAVRICLTSAMLLRKHRTAVKSVCYLGTDGCIYDFA